MTDNTSKNKGCLSIFLPFLGEPTPANRPAARPPAPIVPPRLPYRVRDNFLTPAEFSFYKVLQGAVGTSYTVQSKVRLADIFFIAERQDYYHHFGRISQRHLDFLICDSRTMKPTIGIELDDASHNLEKVRARDEFVEDVFHDARLPLVRFPVHREYNPREIAEMLAPFLTSQKNDGEQPEQDTDEPDELIPFCPKCGIPMILRTVTKGQYRGRQFYGCKNFPNCREMKPVQVAKAQESPTV